MNFYEWMISRYDGKDTPRGDLAYDMKRSSDFPQTGDWDTILRYLRVRRACKEAVAVFKRCFRDYTRAVEAGEVTSPALR